jgi:hypothetical protein
MKDIIPVLLILLLGCTPIFDSKDGENHPIEGNIIFSIKETHYTDEVQSPNIRLLMKTEEIYACYNFSIESAIYGYGNVVFIDIDGYFAPNICLTALGPARSNSAFPLRPGQYVIRFSKQDQVDLCDVTITDEAIMINPRSANFTIMEDSLFWRFVPQSFAYVCGTTLETSWMCEDFLDSLKSVVEIEEFEYPDYGTIPYPDSSYGHYYDTKSRFFTYKSEADFDRAGEVLKDYARRVISGHSGIGIYLQNWQNKKFLSWRYD